MSSFFSNMRSGFGRNNNSKPPQQQQKPGNGGQSPISFDQSQSSPQPNMIPSPIPSPSLTAEHSMSSSMARSTPYFFREQYANLIVKGNFMTLAAKPVLIEEGEWLAHQVVEQNRLLDGMLKILQEVDRNTGLPICNAQTCPAMTSAPGVEHHWYDQSKKPIRVPAPQYIAFVQRWIASKITDATLFPIATFSNQVPALSASSENWLGKSSGFPAAFSSEIRNIYKHMYRVYSHMYHSHWLEFWHLGAYKELNTCFIHFINVGRLFGLLTDKDQETMVPLIEIWLEKGWLPRPQGQGMAQISRVPSRNGSLSAEAGAQQQQQHQGM